MVFSGKEVCKDDEMSKNAVLAFFKERTKGYN